MLGLLAAVELAVGGNPLGGVAGMADANLHVFNDTFYVFATHDYSPNNTGFLMKDWWVWSSPDLVSWTLDSLVQPAVSVKWSTPSEQNECWATDAAFRGGNFYFYLSVGPSEVGVVTSKSPRGPWIDPLGKPLLSDAMGKALHPKTSFRDPCVFLNPEDGEYYIIAGVFEYYVARLARDMITLAEPPRHVTVTNPYGPCGDSRTDDKPFLHYNNGIFYLSWGCFYATGKSVYGPFETRGSVISTATIAPAFRMNNSVPPITRKTFDAGSPAATRAAALRRYTPTSAVPVIGTPLTMARCSAADASVQVWDTVPAVQPNAFIFRLRKFPALCAAGGGQGSRLRLANCNRTSSSQLFMVRNYSGEGQDIVGVDGRCPCWNVNDNNARAVPRSPTGAYVQCFACVDRGSQGFNPNQRFTLLGNNGSIVAWQGYAPGFCVSAMAGTPPTPPAPKPWYLGEDYTDRHGSFLEHKKQWYYVSNDRSHSTDTRNPGVFRDTVACYIHFRANGSMEPCTVDALGVNEHDAFATIEAENFFELAGAGHKVDLRGDGFGIEMYQGDYLRFPNTRHLQGATAIIFRMASTARATITVSIGEVKVRCDLPATSSSFRQVPCALHDHLRAISAAGSTLVLTLSSSTAKESPGLLLDSFTFEFQD